MTGKILCKDCSLWYHSTKADQCDARGGADYLKAVYGIDVPEKFLAVKTGDDYGHPSKLNKDNDCPWFSPTPQPRRGFFSRLFYRTTSK